MKRLCLLFALSSVGVLLLPHHVTASSFTVTPAIIEQALTPGEQKTTTISVRNAASSPLPLALFAEPTALYDEFDPTLRARYDASRWISFTEEVVLFAAGETKTIPVRITVPEDAAAGGHYTWIGLRGLSLSLPSEQFEQTILPQISVSVLFTVAGEANERVEVATKNIFPWYVAAGKSTATTVQMINRGNVHSLVSPVVVIRKDGKDVHRLTLPPQLLLPNLSRNFPVELPALEEAGEYRLAVYLGDSEQPQREEHLIVGPPLVSVAAVASLSWAGLYLFHRRKNVKKAYSILLGRH